MNRDAKVGLFAVLILVVLVAVIWAKLAGNGKDPAVAPRTADSEPLIVSSDRTELPNPPSNSFTNINPTNNQDPPNSNLPGWPAVLADGGRSSTDFAGGTNAVNLNAIRDAFPVTDHGISRGPDDSVSPVSDITPVNNLPSGPIPPSLGVSPLADVITPPVAAAEWPKEHKVARGDSLFGISAKYYGSSKHWKIIAEANKAALPDPRKMKPGMKLRIPEHPAKTETAPPAGNVAGNNSTPPVVADANLSTTPKAGMKYKVKKNDTLSSIARAAYGSDKLWKKILEANKDKLSAPERLRLGMVLVLPEKN